MGQVLQSNYKGLTFVLLLFMKLEIIRVGNSKGLRIPKVMLKQCGIAGYVNAEIHNNSLVLTPINKARYGWANAFKQETSRNEDKILTIVEIKNLWDESEWTW